MNKSNKTNTAAIIPILKGILKEDITVIDQMLVNKSKESKIYKLLRSLRSAKEKILGMLPGGDLHGMNEISSTPRELEIVGYQRAYQGSDNDVKITEILRKTEYEQMKLIRDTAASGGLPDTIKPTLNKITETYMKIVDQLKRSSSTKQLNEIVV